MSLQERTLVVRNFDPEKTSNRLLKELCLQGGPVRNVVMRTDHAFVEFEDTESVGYTKALLDGVELFGKKLILEPKLKSEFYFKYTKMLNDFIKFDKQRLDQIAQQNQHLLYQQSQTQLIYAQQRAMQINPLDGSVPTINPVVPPYNQNVFQYNPYLTQPQVFMTQSPMVAQPSQIPAPNQLMRSQSFQQNRHHPYNRHVRSNRSFSDKDRWTRRA